MGDDATLTTEKQVGKESLRQNKTVLIFICVVGRKNGSRKGDSVVGRHCDHLAFSYSLVFSLHV